MPEQFLLKDVAYPRGVNLAVGRVAEGRWAPTAFVDALTRPPLACEDTQVPLSSWRVENHSSLTRPKRLRSSFVCFPAVYNQFSSRRSRNVEGNTKAVAIRSLYPIHRLGPEKVTTAETLVREKGTDEQGYLFELVVWRVRRCSPSAGRALPSTFIRVGEDVPAVLYDNHHPKATIDTPRSKEQSQDSRGSA
jgi:hypothetical protein